jgi:hypothetical protein
MDDPLFQLVVPPPVLPELRGKRYGAVGAKWTKWSGARRPCDDCVQRIHDLGTENAPHPAAAMWRRKGPNGDLWLCAVDADERKRLDQQAERDRDETFAYREHVKKAERSR